MEGVQCHLCWHLTNTLACNHANHFSRRYNRSLVLKRKRVKQQSQRGFVVSLYNEEVLGGQVIVEQSLEQVCWRGVVYFLQIAETILNHFKRLKRRNIYQRRECNVALALDVVNHVRERYWGADWWVALVLEHVLDNGLSCSNHRINILLCFIHKLLILFLVSCHCVLHEYIAQGLYLPVLFWDEEMSIDVLSTHRDNWDGLIFSLCRVNAVIAIWELNNLILVCANSHVVWDHQILKALD